MGQNDQGKNNLKASEVAQFIAGNSGQTGGQSPEMAELVALLSRKLGRELRLEDEQIALQEKARQANADYMVQVAQEQKATQQNCPHIKPRNGGTALAGQKTHKGHYVFICQYCAKEFSDPPQSVEQKVPSHLYPDMALVGGPHQ